MLKAQVYDVTWNDQGNHPYAQRVLVLTHPSANYAHSFLYALSVGSGFDQENYGSGLNVLQSQDVEDQYNTTIIQPIFPMDSWYADNPTDATIDYYTFVSTILPQWVDSHFSATGDEKSLLLGFSKSGYVALDLLFRNPTEFDAAAAFDFLGDITSYNGFGTSEANDYGTQAISKTIMSWTKVSSTPTKRRSQPRIVSGLPRVLIMRARSQTSTTC
jgi:pimeloyl-ACP methyl ester carboxylesterase